MMDKLEKMFEGQISQLNEKEQIFFRSFKNKFFSIYNNLLKPIMLGVFLFWLFTRIKNAIGIQEAFYIQGIFIIIFLRMIASRLA